LNTGLSHADKGTKGFVQCLANAMASVGALPIKFHEPTVMALACSVNLWWFETLLICCDAVVVVEKKDTH
jgi:hypothetical protein